MNATSNTRKNRIVACAGKAKDHLMILIAGLAHVLIEQRSDEPFA